MNNSEIVYSRKRFGRQIVFGQLFIIALLQLVPFLRYFSVFESLGSQTLSYIYYAYMVTMYLSFSVLIYIEVDCLDEFHFDRFTIGTLIIGSIINPRIGLAGESFLKILLGVSGFVILLILALKKPNIQKTSTNWVLIGIVTSCTVVVLLTLIEAALFGNRLNINNIRVFTVLGLIIRELPSAPVIEEVLMRGFLWGYLKSYGMSENKVVWAQGVLFWALHVSKIFTSFSLFSFFITIPLLTVLYSMITLRSKQLFPAIISHLLVNVVSIIFALSIF